MYEALKQSWAARSPAFRAALHRATWQLGPVYGLVSLGNCTELMSLLEDAGDDQDELDAQLLRAGQVAYMVGHLLEWCWTGNDPSSTHGVSFGNFPLLPREHLEHIKGC
ncbi:hypothetical protein ABBQ38_004218 [Trebouxia sp. C0009 RCD-2024]